MSDAMVNSRNVNGASTFSLLDKHVYLSKYVLDFSENQLWHLVNMFDEDTTN